MSDRALAIIEAQKYPASFSTEAIISAS